ncbi:MAG: alpha-glucuronidase [Lewinellaceae bacterium]|nr:alpha-glucuronidase [Saprospiraceae bacterium]MCB9334412.1 alpha-glucuronidase [Lewinellaceae bacterium]
MIRLGLIIWVCMFTSIFANAEDGYQLWLRYNRIQNANLLQRYTNSIATWAVFGNSQVVESARNELRLGLQGLLNKQIPESTELSPTGSLAVGTPHDSPLIRSLGAAQQLDQVDAEGYAIYTTSSGNFPVTVITGNSDIGVLYGVFHFLRLLQTQQPIENLSIVSNPKIKRRLLNHWDNLDRTVERGYAGCSIWDWHRLPDFISPRYTDYARANASIGINGTVLTNVNANALIFRADYLDKIKALADVFRPYGIKVYLTARFSAPIELDGLPTADPLDPRVQSWWQEKVAEIYKLIPDFGGFLVKANSEGQPGPQNYNRTHADGANMLADALAPYNGVVMWRAFVYSNAANEDRAKLAYNEFVPLDGSFRKNVLVQVKNGPIDFQPREPVHPMFGAMPKTPLMMEFQITQEYLGQGTHLVYLAPMYTEALKFDTYAKGPGSEVAKIIDGQLDNHALSGMAGVSNIGNDRNWTGHLFGQSNWFAYGRLAWDPDMDAAEIADEWIRMTFSNEPDVIRAVSALMLMSHEICVQYMTPLGLHHLFDTGHHYGPGPWVNDLSQREWNPTYYHQADRQGIGFDRTATGSNATSQYFEPWHSRFESPTECPEKYLLWFHRVRWTDTLDSGQSLWEALCRQYDAGCDGVVRMHAIWNSVVGKIDSERYNEVDMMLHIQEKEARWWRDACLSYFQSISGLPFPAGFDPPQKTLEYFKSRSFPYAPGTKPRW